MKMFLYLLTSVAFIWPLACFAQSSGSYGARQPGSSQNSTALRPGNRADLAGMEAVPGNVPLNSLVGTSTDYRIGPNDLIDIEVYGVSDLKRTVRVNSSGIVSLALVGNVGLTGLTAQQAEEVIARRYAEKYLQDPQVSVFIREFTSQRVTIEGAVIRPGIYPLTGNITLLRAIALAGGGAQFADMKDIMVFRSSGSGNVVIPFDLEKIRSGEKPDPVVVAEDVIVVKRDATRTLLRDSIFRDVLDAINPFSVFTR